eukprot:scaffold117202_cov30-Tisochrysis_lutea.AAC.1
MTDEVERRVSEGAGHQKSKVKSPKSKSRCRCTTRIWENLYPLIYTHIHPTRAFDLGADIILRETEGGGAHRKREERLWREEQGATLELELLYFLLSSRVELYYALL